MPPLHLIAACSSNRIMGRAGKLPWRIAEDLAWFDAWTQGRTVLLGRICYETWPQAHERGRQPVVVTSRSLDELHCPAVPAGGNQALLVPGVQEALHLVSSLPGPVMVCGGARIFAECLPLASRLYLTEIHAEIAGDVSFPDWSRHHWNCLHRYSSSNSQYRYTFSILEKVRGVSGEAPLSRHC